MEVAVAWTLTGVLVTLLGTSVVVIGIMSRRNGRNNRNNLTLQIVDEKLNEILIVLTAMKTILEFCPTVVSRRGK